MSAIERNNLNNIPESETRFMVMPIVFVRPRRIIERDGISVSQTFLLRKKGIEYWTLVGGHLEDTEKVSAATAREAKEEAGIEIQESDLQLRYIAHLKDSIGQRICYFLDTWKWSGELINKEPEKAEEVGWFDDDNLPLMKPVTKQCLDAINKLNNGQFDFGEYGF